MVYNVLQLDKTISPHQGENIIFAGSAIEESDSAMILLHGRGAEAASMKGLTAELETERMVYIIPEARNYTWYPLRFIEKRELNEPALTSGLILIDAIVNALGNNGFQKANIYILGFSQGACLGVEYVARYPARFAGVFALSGGLIGEKISVNDYHGDLDHTPVFFGCSDSDIHIPAQRIDESVRIFENLNADVTKKIYPDLGHAINQDEMNFINKILSARKVIQDAPSRM